MVLLYEMLSAIYTFQLTNDDIHPRISDDQRHFQLQNTCPINQEEGGEMGEYKGRCTMTSTHES